MSKEAQQLVAGGGIAGACGRSVGVANCRDDLGAYDRDGAGSFDPDANVVTARLKDGDDDVVTDLDLLANAAP